MANDRRINFDPELDQLERKVRLVCGALLGLVIAYFLWFFFGPFSPPLLVAVPLTCAVACAFLALRYGDRFWQRLSESLNFL
jgi:hypothetical protein